MFNTDWRVVWMAHYMLSRHREAVCSVFPRCPGLGAGEFLDAALLGFRQAVVELG